ncbi:unnamed protein product, partial [Medioppia subpectinata]
MGLKVGTRIHVCGIIHNSGSMRDILANIVRESDFIMCNVYPDNNVVKSGAAKSVEAVGNAFLGYRQKFKEVNGNIEVMIGETGWPSEGISFNASPNNAKNLRDYWSQMGEWANKNKVTVHMFEAIDEPWKSSKTSVDMTSPSGPNGAEGHYGWWQRVDTPGKPNYVTVFAITLLMVSNGVSKDSHEYIDELSQKSCCATYTKSKLILIKDHIIDDKFKDLTEKYKWSESDVEDNETINSIVDSIQCKYNCCGTDSYKSWQQLRPKKVEWYPNSCCCHLDLQPSQHNCTEQLANTTVNSCFSALNAKLKDIRKSVVLMAGIAIANSVIKLLAPSSPQHIKKEGKFKKFRRNFHKSTNDLKVDTNLTKQRSVSTSALNHMDDRHTSHHLMVSKRNSVVSMTTSLRTTSSTHSSGSDEECAEPLSPVSEEPKNNQISVKELIEKMITHLQVLERKNEILTQSYSELSDEKSALETELSSTKVELNLYKNRLNQIETMADEWHCSVCLDNKIKIVNTKRQIVSTLCGHLFCSSCAQSFMNSSRPSKYCPTCHKPLKDVNVVRNSAVLVYKQVLIKYILFMKRLSRTSFRRSTSHLDKMMDSSLDTSSQTNSMISDSDSSTLEFTETLPPSIPPPPPPRPPPRRRRKHSTPGAVFYCEASGVALNEPHSAPVGNDDNQPFRPLVKRPSVPPPIPPRTVSMDESWIKRQTSVFEKNSQNSFQADDILSTNQMFTNEELIKNLTQNLSVIEDLNFQLRSELKVCREEMFAGSVNPLPPAIVTLSTVWTARRSHIYRCFTRLPGLVNGLKHMDPNLVPIGPLAHLAPIVP